MHVFLAVASAEASHLSAALTAAAELPHSRLSIVSLFCHSATSPLCRGLRLLRLLQILILFRTKNEIPLGFMLQQEALLSRPLSGLASAAKGQREKWMRLFRDFSCGSGFRLKRSVVCFGFLVARVRGPWEPENEVLLSLIICFDFRSSPPSPVHTRTPLETAKILQRGCHRSG